MEVDLLNVPDWMGRAQITESQDHSVVGWEGTSQGAAGRSIHRLPGQPVPVHHQPYYK